MYPATGYALTLDDFEMMLGQNEAEVGKLLSRWFEYRTRRVGSSIVVEDSHGSKVDLLSVHRKIQADPAMQRELYGLSMELWR